MSSITGSGDIRTDYMTLLVAQLQNQNPMEPMDNSQMASQLAQLSQLEQLETMNASFAKVLDSQLQSQALGIIGKEISFLPTGGGDALTGRVDSIDLSGGGLRLIVDDRPVELDQLQSVGN